MAEVATESIGAVRQTDPNAVGGARPTEAVLAETGRVMHPADQASSETGGAPGQAPGAATEERSEADWKASLPPDVAKRVDQVITKLRQEDSGKIRDLEAQAQRLAWADEMNRLVASENPADRQRAIALLDATLGTLRKLTPEQASAQDPMAGVDWNTVESVAPGLKAAFEHQSRRLGELYGMLGETRQTSEAIVHEAATEKFAQEAYDLEKWAKENGLPFDLDKVVETENRLGIADLKSAYYATYGQDLVGAGKKAAETKLAQRQAASLPGGTATGGAPTRRKMASMHEHWEAVKRERGITGPVEYK